MYKIQQTHTLSSFSAYKNLFPTNLPSSITTTPKNPNTINNPPSNFQKAQSQPQKHKTITMAIVDRQTSHIPSGGIPLEWLLVLCNYTSIPMYQIIRILQNRFHQPYDPVLTRQLYERMEEDMERPYCRVVQAGRDDYNTQVILEEAAGEKARVDEEERVKPKKTGRGR